jgi:hypothetical protein
VRILDYWRLKTSEKLDRWPRSLAHNIPITVTIGSRAALQNTCTTSPEFTTVCKQVQNTYSLQFWTNVDENISSWNSVC